MGKLNVFLKYIFFVFSSDVNESRRHIRVTDKKRDLERLCKFWVEPNIELEYNIGFTQKEIKEIEKIIHLNISDVNAQLELFCSHKKVKSIIKNE